MRWSVQFQAESFERHIEFEKHLVTHCSIASLNRYTKLIASLARSRIADEYQVKLDSYFSRNADKDIENVNERLEPLLVEAEQNGVRRSYIVYALAGLVSLLLLFSGAAPLLANLLSVVYPLYASVEAIRVHDNNATNKWLTYWSVFGVISVVDEAIGCVHA